MAEDTPTFSIIAEGKDITKIISDCLQDISLTDYGGATEKADELKINLISPTMKLPKKGARLRLGFGFNHENLDKGWFVVKSVSSGGPPRKIGIVATAAPMNSSKHNGDVKNQKTRSWNDVKLGDIIKTISQDNGLIHRVSASLAEIKVDHIDQVGESDASFVAKLARQYNAVSKPTGGYWVFMEQGAGTTVSGKEIKAITITPENVSRWDYSEGRQGEGEKEKKGRVYVNYYDEESGKTVPVHTEHNGEDLRSPFTQPKKEVAQRQAESKKDKTEKNERRMTLSGACRQWMLPLTAEMKVTTKGFGEREDFTWLVESLSFSINSQSGFSYQFNLVKSIDKKGKDKDKAPDYYS